MMVKFPAFIFLLFLLFSACEKKDKEDVNSCSTPPCSNYLITWNDIIKARNHLPESYLEEHFKVLSSKINTHPNGLQFIVEYTYSVDWLEISLQDYFMVKIANHPTAYPNHQLNRGVFLSMKEIDALISFQNLDSYVSEIGKIEKLDFSSIDEAIAVVRAKAKTTDMFFDRLGFKKSEGGYIANGHPYLFCIGKEDPVSHTRLDAEIDLVSRRVSTYPTQVQEKTSSAVNP